MWSNLPFDLLANIFSYLSPDSLARAKAVCRNWHECAPTLAVRHRQPPWLVVLSTGGQCVSCYVHNVVGGTWHMLHLDCIMSPIRPIATAGGLVVLRVTNTTSLQLAICNPFTRQFRTLPVLNSARTNPAVAVVENNSSHLGFKIYVAGGMSEAASGGAAYQPTVEMYESDRGTWDIVGTMPMEFAVRLTVWTPNESVYSDGVLYWMTSARAYSVMGYEMATNRWRELSVPMADQLEFAALAPRNGNLAMVGGMCGGDVCIWELGRDGAWSVVEKVPFELGVRLLGDKLSWGGVKCVGIDGSVCLYRDLGSGIIVWREVFDEGKWEWTWIEGCCSIRGRRILQNLPIKAVLLHPNLVQSVILVQQKINSVPGQVHGPKTQI